MDNGEGADHGEGADPAVGLEPAAVAEADFATVRRGYEPAAVRARLREAAEEIGRLNTLVGSLSERIEVLEATPAEVLESRRVAEALGDEATRILQSAGDAARERAERAEADHARIVGEAQVTAAATVEDSREQGRHIVLEARNVRDRVLADLGRRRRQYQIEVEQLREMRDRLLETLGTFRQGLDGWVDDLVRAGPQAAAAAERAGLRAAAQPEPTVAQIESEIQTARLAGRPLDGRPADQSPDLSDLPSEGEVSVPDDSAGPGQTALDSSHDDGELLAIGGLSLEPLLRSSGSPARLYDVEAEAGTTLDAAGEGFAGSAPQDVEDGSGAASTEAGFDADAIFARLREIADQPVRVTPEPIPAEPDGRDVQAPPDLTEVGDEPAELSDEFADAAVGQHEAPADPDDPDDLYGAARAVAVGAIARRLKRQIVDEQGDLLDGIRRNGVRALRSVISGDTDVYTRAARRPMQDFASDIDVSIDDIDLAAAGAAIISVLVEPVRSRLGELIDETEDADELSSVVRSVYRESRARRADSAAEAAFSAGWPEPIA